LKSIRLPYKAIADYLRKINWTLLVFLILFINVKMLVKIPVIIILLLVNRSMFSEKSIYRQKFIWFYCCLAGITILNVLVNISTFSINYLVAATVGAISWVLCAAAAFLSYWFVMTTDVRKLRATISLFFLLNAAVTIGQLLYIMWDSGSVNPYTFQGMYQKYFINTGDRMTGLSFDVSTTNAVLNSMGVLYFLYSGKIHFTLLCMVTLLLTASNFTNILLVLVLLFVFIFKSTKWQKSIIVVCLLLLVLFMARISPQNNRYVAEEYREITNTKRTPAKQPKDITNLTQVPDSLLNDDEQKQKIAQLFIDSLRNHKAKRNKNDFLFTTPVIKPGIPIPDIHTGPFQRNKDSSSSQKKLFSFAVQYLPPEDSSRPLFTKSKIPGKLEAFRQTIFYFKDHPEKIITGAGTGNFSSKLAFRATGLQAAGGYPEKFVYINNDFLQNHLSLYLFYFSQGVEAHSLIHSPNAVYDQLIAEYGLAGILSFIFFYILYFLKTTRRLTYGIPILLLMLMVLGVDYWYEQLSIIIIFELLMLLNLKETQHKNE
jgi:hypothetical protein